MNTQEITEEVQVLVERARQFIIEKEGYPSCRGEDDEITLEAIRAVQFHQILKEEYIVERFPLAPVLVFDRDRDKFRVIDNCEVVVYDFDKENEHNN